MKALLFNLGPYPLMLLVLEGLLFNKNSNKRKENQTQVHLGLYLIFITCVLLQNSAMDICEPFNHIHICNIIFRSFKVYE